MLGAVAERSTKRTLLPRCIILDMTTSRQLPLVVSLTVCTYSHFMSIWICSWEWNQLYLIDHEEFDLMQKVGRVVPIAMPVSLISSLIR
jgi:hypothetical protein